MSINPQDINLASLPWLPLEAKSAFPQQPAIYFAIDFCGNVQYIGRSVNPKSRWSSHHKFPELQKIGQIKISYLFIESIELLPEIEKALILWFDPPLNTAKLCPLSSPKEKCKLVNTIKSFVDKRGISVYQFRKDTGIGECSDS